jgi:hypothetical protein
VVGDVTGSGKGRRGGAARRRGGGGQAESKAFSVHVPRPRKKLLAVGRSVSVDCGRSIPSARIRTVRLKLDCARTDENAGPDAIPMGRKEPPGP